MKNFLSIAAFAAVIATTSAASAQNIPARNSDHTGPGHQVTDYPYIEGGSYVSPYANGNNVGEWSRGKDADSQCYHGNYGYNGQTSNYDHSECVVVYDAQTYVRLLKGSGAAGGTQYFGN